MGYYANGSGTITTNEKDMEAVIKALKEEFEVIEEGPASNTELFIQTEGNYHGDEIGEILTCLVGKATGTIEFCGGDNTFWTFHLREDGWEEVPAAIVWDGTDALYEAVNTYGLCPECKKEDCCYAKDGKCRYYLVKETAPEKTGDECNAYLKEVA